MTAARRDPHAAERGWSRQASPFHPGEWRVQELVGVRDQMERAGRNMIRERLAAAHRELFEALPFIVVGSVGKSGALWASFLCGEPGFVRASSATLLRVAAEPAAFDPLGEPLGPRAPLGILGIQLATRRRARVNGRVVERDAQSFTLQVEQTFGNCPQYIQAREPHFDPELAIEAGPARAESARLSPRARRLLESSDTFFIATASANPSAEADGEGVDVSHRGGRAGFVRVSERAPDGNGIPHAARAFEEQQAEPRSVLTFPDFRGNFMFNTLGNLQVNPRASILCADFQTRDVLSLTGRARILWDGPELEHFAGAERLIEFEVERGVFRERALPLHFEGFSESRNLEGTGTWPESIPAR